MTDVVTPIITKGTIVHREVGENYLSLYYLSMPNSLAYTLNMIIYIIILLNLIVIIIE